MAEMCLTERKREKKGQEVSTKENWIMQGN